MTLRIEAKTYLNQKEKVLIEALERECLIEEGIALKLELDYKMACAESKQYEESDDKNEFMAWQEDTLVGYMGISSFGGSMPEVNGMVARGHRRKGVFQSLYLLVCEEAVRRKSKAMLLLTDGKSEGGQAFVKSKQVDYDHTEFEMTNALVSTFLLQKERSSASKLQLRLATNADQQEITAQNAIYFDCDPAEVPQITPEDEATRGMYIYIAEVNNQIVGKANLQVMGDGFEKPFKAGVFGVGVIPSFRRLGYGRDILMNILLKCQEHGVDYCFLQVEAKNEAALTLYSSCGFEVTSTMVYSRLGL